MSLTVTDLFAGFGGASTGATQIPGIDLRIAANHWDLAIEVHNANHPDTEHAHVDLHEEDPRKFPTTDILWASPECTQWSQARGKAADLPARLNEPTLFDNLDDELVSDDAATRSRLLMFDVLRFADHHRYKYMVVENVVDIATQAKYRYAWEAWQRGLRTLGYQYRVVSLNSMHAQALGDPAPQSRDRLYIVCWLTGLPVPDIDRFMRPKAWCGRCDGVVESFQAWKPQRSVGKYRTQYVYMCSKPGCGEIVEPAWLPAAAAIDWTLPGKRIGDRTKPLADKTRARIAAGIARYWGPIHIEAGGNQYDAADPKHARHGDPNGYYRAWSTDDVLRTLHTAETKALAVPLEGRDGKQAKPTTEPLRTQTTRHDLALLTPAGGTWNDDSRPTCDPHRTMTTRETTALVQPPFLTQFRDRVRDIDPEKQPLPTIVADGANHGLVQPFILERRHEYRTRPIDQPLSTLTANETTKALLTPYYGASQSAQSTSEPIGTLTTVDRYALVTRHNSQKGDESHLTTPASEAFRTLTTTAQQSIITPGDLAAAEARVDDCLFRMLEPHEVGAGMAFPSSYIVKGSRRNQVKGYGNAVTPPAARDLIGAVAEAFHRIEIAA